MKKNICYITANTDTLYETEIIKIMSRQSAVLGYDLVVLTHFVNYDDGGNYIKGDENIYTLINYFHLDGAVFNRGSFYSKILADRIEQLLKDKNIPVIALDHKSSEFESCIQKDREYFRQLTEHMIKVHGFRKIYCLSGPEGDHHASERIKGYKDALRANGIPVRKEYIYYGDFWIERSKGFAEDILSGRISRPEAVVCGNDHMALRLCLTLGSGGMHIPDDIAVAGFDGNPDALKYQPTLTTFSGAYLKNASEAVCRIHELISGEREYERIAVTPCIRTGSSCGCKNDISRGAVETQMVFSGSLISNIYLHSNYSSMMNKAATLDECALTILQNLYLLDDKSDFFLCLCDDQNVGNGDLSNNRIDGYTEEMNCILSQIKGKGDMIKRKYMVESIIPSSFLETEPVTYICSPLHYLERCLGYCVRRYREKIVFEEYFGGFCQIAANAIEKIRMLQYKNYLNEQIQKLSERDILTGLYSKKGLESYIRENDMGEQHFGMMFYFEDFDDHDDKNFDKIIISFAQAVNLSCTNGMIAARTGAGNFIVIGSCDGPEHPEQLFVNTIKLNLKMIEKQQKVEVLKDLRHFTVVSDRGVTPEELLVMIEKKYESYKSAGSEKNIAYLSKIQKLHYSIYEEPQLEWNSESEAEKLGISQSYFQHIYRKYINESFNSDVISARLTLAERLLANTALNVSEISERCGYSDPLHFMKLFKRKKGKTALEYRKMHDYRK